jgi:hypothetical protein
MSIQFLMDFAATNDGFQTILRNAAEYNVVQGVALGLDPYWLYSWRLAQQFGDSLLHGLPRWGFPWLSDTHIKQRLLEERLGVFPRPILDEEILKWRPPGWSDRTQWLSISDLTVPIVAKICIRPALLPSERTPSVEALRAGVDGLRVIVQTEPQSNLCANPRRKYLPVVGGVSIGVGAKDFATLGVVLEDDKGDRFALTCAHVAAKDDDILQPSQRDSKKATVIGKSVLATILSPCSVSDACNDKSGVATNELDLSLIQIDPAISSKQEILDIGALNGVVPISSLSCGQTVEVMGRSCKHKTLQLGDFHVFRRHEHNGQYYCYKNMVRVESPYGATDVIKGGDSGAPVCITSGGGKGLCGMIVAANVFGGFAMFGESIEAWWKQNGYSFHI